MTQSFGNGPAAPGTELFVAGIPTQATEASLRTHFEKYGQIQRTRIIRDVNTKESKGFGFVAFADPTDAEDALAANGSMLLGKRIKVTPSRNDPSSRNTAAAGKIPETYPDGQIRVARVDPIEDRDIERLLAMIDHPRTQEKIAGLIDERISDNNQALREIMAPKP